MPARIKSIVYGLEIELLQEQQNQSITPILILVTIREETWATVADLWYVLLDREGYLPYPIDSLFED